MDPLDTLAAGRAEFERRVAAIGDDQWRLPTPCDEWDVSALVHHVVSGNAMSVVLLAGGTREEGQAAREATTLGSDPLGAFQASADALDQAFRRPGALEVVIHHRVGDIPAPQFLGFRFTDYTVHSWDLARAIGGDETLDPELVAVVYEAMLPMAGFIGKTGQFGAGPSDDVDEQASLQYRLLDLSGRRP
ncbi:MAG: hypothetical protein QOG87_2970 [Actinomycetota bacterium]|jgi:uncharacterized protein (TIGR03086 family)